MPPFELPSRLLSGPDLGGGFLFQLTRDREPAGFTFHLQDAGTDAAARPAGVPERLGFAHPPGACMYGGPGCWEKSFLLPEPELPRVRAAYNRTRFVIGPMLRQATDPPPPGVFEDGWRETLARIVGPLAAESIPWEVTGPAAAWFRGVPLGVPGEVGLATTPSGAARLGELLEAYLVEPVHPSGASVPTGTGPASSDGAAFVGTFRAGLRIGWSGRPGGAAGALPAGPGSPGRAAPGRPVMWEGIPVSVVPLEIELVRSARGGEAERADRIVDHLNRVGWDPRLLAPLLDGPELAPEVADRIRARLSGPSGPVQA